MLGLFKAVGVSAVLAAGVVALANEPQRAEAAPLPTAALEQVSNAAPKTEPQPNAHRDETKPNPCEGQTWPYISPACMAPESGRPARKVRIISADTALSAAPARR